MDSLFCLQVSVDATLTLPDDAAPPADDADDDDEDDDVIRSKFLHNIDFG